MWKMWEGTGELLVENVRGLWWSITWHWWKARKHWWSVPITDGMGDIALAECKRQLVECERALMECERQLVECYLALVECYLALVKCGRESVASRGQGDLWPFIKLSISIPRSQSLYDTILYF